MDIRMAQLANVMEHGFYERREKQAFSGQAGTVTSRSLDDSALQQIFSWKKAGQMVLVGLGLGAAGCYWPAALGIFSGLPLGILNYYLACRAVASFGGEKSHLFGMLMGIRWLLAMVLLFVVYQLGGVWCLLGAAVGVEIQMFSQLVDGFLLLPRIIRGR